MATDARRLAAAVVLTSLQLAMAESNDVNDFFADAQDPDKWTWKHFVVAGALAAFVVCCLPTLICMCLGKLLCEAIELIVCCPCNTIKCLCCGGSKSRGLELESSDEDSEDEDIQEEQLVNRGLKNLGPTRWADRPGPASRLGRGRSRAAGGLGAAPPAAESGAAAADDAPPPPADVPQHYAHQQAAAVQHMRAAQAPAYHYGYPGQQQVMYAR
ncbi:unnamed protein product [Prorocentrum cordatum]|uniref:Uncharacterized protein n=1 Tax=Prorocentrum cordatum TaxID=2364126 RepID=A0ABN9QVT8_9DINO|nr:unnamed protein product [Polarella glacialis]